MDNSCSKCGGTGKVASHLNPYGIKRSAGMAMDVCPACAGTGRDKSHVSSSSLRSGAGEPGGATILVWAFGILGALIIGISSESAFDIWWPIGAFLGFGGGALGASILVMFKLGRLVLWLALLAFIVAVIFAIRSGSG